MPELPEVETTRRGLLEAMDGKQITRAIQNRDNLRWPLPDRFSQRLTGARVLSMRRRAKYMLFDLDLPTAAPETLIIHLGMSGRMMISDSVIGSFEQDTGASQKHDHVLFEMEQGKTVTFNDPRRFGAMDLWPTLDLHNHKFFADMGPEPLGNQFDDTYLHTTFRGKKTPLKSALLNQKIVAGLGNIYVCEALHMSRLSPLREAGQTTAAQCADLTQAIRTVLELAIAAGGSSLKDFRQADGELGYFQHAFKTYDREGKNCLNAGCNGTIERIVQSGRSTFYCQTCQR